MDNPATAPIPGYTGTADTELQQYWLDVAWRALQGEDGTLVARIQRGNPPASTVADVVTAAARRVLRNPEGRQSEEGAIDDYREGWRNADATEDIYFTAAEKRRLGLIDPSSLGAGSLKYC